MDLLFSMRKTGAALLMAATAAALSPAAAHAGDDTTRIVIGFAPGGALDVLARALADKMRHSLGGTVLVENKPGASTRLALQAVKQAAPDGKTILISPAPPFVLFPMTYPRLGYDADKDFIPVAHLTDVPLVASTSVAQPFKTMPEYLAWAKTHPESPGVGIATLGGSIHFGILSMGKALNMPLAPTAYRGASMMMTDVVGGSLPIGIDAVTAQMGLQKAGKIRFLGITGTRRSSLLPDVPTLQESGVAGFEIASGWYIAFVPAGTPAATVARLEKALIEAVKDPALQTKLATTGMEATGLSGAEAGRIIQSQRAQWKPIVQASGFTAEE